MISWMSDIDRAYYIQVWQNYATIYDGVIHQLDAPIVSPAISNCGGTVGLTLFASTPPTTRIGNSCRNATPLTMLQNQSAQVVVTHNESSVEDDRDSVTIVYPCTTMESLQPGNIHGIWWTYHVNTTTFPVVAAVLQLHHNKCEVAVQILISNATTNNVDADCSMLSCMDNYVQLLQSTSSSTSDTCLQNIIRFRTIENTTRYYFFLYGSGILDPDFQLTYQEITVPNQPSNDQCMYAESIVTDGRPKVLNFTLAARGNVRPDQLFLDTAASLWYTISRPFSTRMTMEICGPAYPNIFTGSCWNGTDRFDLLVPSTTYTYNDTNNQHDDDDDDDDGVISSNTFCTSYRFETTPSETYLLSLRILELLSNTSSPFMTVWEEDSTILPTNANCQNAIGPLPYNGTTPVAGAITDATVTSTTTESATTYPSSLLLRDVYYYTDMHAMDQYARGEICNVMVSDGTIFDFNVSLHVTRLEDCPPRRMDSDSGTLVLPMTSDGCIEFFWRNEIQYAAFPLIIGIWSIHTFNFTITLREWNDAALPLNDRQPDLYDSADDDDNTSAFRINVGTTIQGTTAHALSDHPRNYQGVAGFCTTDGNQPGVWYTIVGTDQDLAVCYVTTSNNRTTNTAQLAVVGTLIDVDAIFTGCLPDATYEYDFMDCSVYVRWPTILGRSYLLLVQTNGPEEFQLTLMNMTNDPVLPTCANQTPTVSPPTTLFVPQPNDKTSIPTGILQQNETSYTSNAMLPSNFPVVDDFKKMIFGSILMLLLWPV